MVDVHSNIWQLSSLPHAPSCTIIILTYEGDEKILQIVYNMGLVLISLNVKPLQKCEII